VHQSAHEIDVPSFTYPKDMIAGKIKNMSRDRTTPIRMYGLSSEG